MSLLESGELRYIKVINNNNNQQKYAMECLKKSWGRWKKIENLQSMYKIVKSCVRCPESLTDFFNCPRGVGQGCVLSPTLLSFFTNELAPDVAKNGLYGVQLTPDIIQILIMLFADEVILTSYCVLQLQTTKSLLFSFHASCTESLTCGIELYQRNE